jgi:hypothetical protein
MPHDTPTVNLKLDPASKRTLMEPAQPEPPQYPWGTRLTLDDEVLKKLGLDKLPEVGAELVVYGMAKAVAVRSDATEHGGSRSVELQITDLSVKPKGQDQPRSAEQVLYPRGDGAGSFDMENST